MLKNMFLNTDGTLNIIIVMSIFNMMLTIFGWWAVYYFGFRKSKKEININQKINIYEKIIYQNVDRVLESYYQVSVLIVNKDSVRECNIRSERDFYKKLLRGNSAQLIIAQSDFWKNFQRMNDLFQAWRPLFSKKIDYESKFLSKIAWSFYNMICEYQQKLDRLLLFYIDKTNDDLKVEKEEIIKLEEQISTESVLFANAIEKFTLDMSKEVFNGLYEKEDEQRLFSLEIENLKDGNKFNILTEDGINKKAYRKTEFQKKYGSMLKR